MLKKEISTERLMIVWLANALEKGMLPEDRKSFLLVSVLLEDC